MAKLLDMSYREPYWSEKDKTWYVAYDSKAFFEWYKKCEEKGLEGFKPYVEYSRETVRYYLRGLYDSEGNNYRNKQIQLFNSKERLLKYVQYLLKEYFGIIATGPYLKEEAGSTRVIKGVEYHYNQDYYVIQIGRKKYAQKYLKEIGFSIIRKQLGLEKDEKLYVEGKFVEPYELVKLGLFKLPFS